MTDRIDIAGLKIAPELHAFVAEAAEGTGVDPQACLGDGPGVAVRHGRVQGQSHEEQQRARLQEFDAPLGAEPVAQHQPGGYEGAGSKSFQHPDGSFYDDKHDEWRERQQDIHLGSPALSAHPARLSASP